MHTTMATATTPTPPRPVGAVLREWRERRRLSQMALALEAEVSTRHVSFLETGRARPSREMLLRLAERLDVPLRDQNTLLLAAGFAPAHPERTLDDEALTAARAIVDRVLTGHEPYPALAIDQQWTLVAANRAVAPLLAGVAPTLLEPPVNVLRLSLHPDGLAPRIANLPQWRAHLLDRLRRQIDLTADPTLSDLLTELHAYPDRIDQTPPDRTPPAASRPATSPPGTAQNDTAIERALAAVAIPLRLRTAHGLLSLISTTMVFGTPVDITLSELAIESFFPADSATAVALHRLAVDQTVSHRDG